MSTPTPSITQQLSQSLSQLTKAASTTQAAKSGVDVTVQQGVGNQIILTDTRRQNVTIPTPRSPSAIGLAANGQYRINVTQHQGQHALLFKPLDSASPSSFSTLQQTTTALAGNAVNTQDVSRLLQGITTDKMLNIVRNLAAHPLPSSPNSSFQIINARVLAAAGQQVTLQLSSSGVNHPVTVTLPEGQTPPKVGQQVNVALTLKNQSVIANILAPSQTTKGENKREFSTLANGQLQGNLANILPKLGQAISLTVDKQQLIRVLFEVSPSQTKGQISNSLATIQGASVPISLSQTAKGFSLDISGMGQSGKGEHPFANAAKPASLSLPIDSKTLQTLLDTFPKFKGNIKEVSANIQNPIHSPTPASLTAQIQSAVQQMVRQAMPLADSPSIGLMQITQALSDTQNKSPETKALLQQLQQALKVDKVAGDLPDTQQLKTLLTAPSAPITPVTLTQPINQQGMMAGLTAILQATLSSRLAKTQRGAADTLMTNVLTFLTTTTGKRPNTVSPRTQQDLSLIDSKHSLLKGLGKIFATHQQSKARSAEQAMQGQDVLYYVLPQQQGQPPKDIELLIRREQDAENGENKQTDKQQRWLLTMKLSAGALGDVLAKAALTSESINIDFYTSSDSLTDLIHRYLPLLTKRLEDAGILVAKSSCQRGHIPDTLNSRPYSIVETHA
ncbi:flagellar hook-length control protein FliK [Aestuariibacter sp. AA17]|uniref:Flagellar hook-length control protein FliK n=1 Tax=Fluctibacter corallii TaxID=2984329 RepID=A0ABT3A3P3_9ALTE|nr:flagellar hook-length control protein FliK [Aestuariibacter sp. AA17]MCV2883308.1 flagellar hook-length control protein FliK [Aestuariibacter sp. AA17]